MDPAFFEVTKTGEVLSRLTTDTTLIQSLSGIGLSILLRSTVSFLGSLVLLLLTSLKLALIIFALIPTVLAPMLLFGRRVRRLSRDSQDRVADTSGLAGETLNAIQTVQAFTLEELHGRRYDDAVEKSFDTAVRRTRVRAWLIAAAIMTTFCSVTLVLWLGARAVLRRHDDRRRSRQIPELRHLHGHVGGGAGGDVGRAAARRGRHGAHRRAAGFAPVASSMPANPVAAEPGAERADLASSTCRSTIRRGPNARALDDFHLEIAPGETVAFVGPSGAGKSTVFQLLLRFYDPAAGRILIDGVDIALRRSAGGARAHRPGAAGNHDLRRQRAREHPLWPPGGQRRGDRSRGARRGRRRIHPPLPEGYDTFLGETGARLSGGQKQRIAIARAILKNPPILLLDEATSSLDSESERLVQDALEKLMRDRTTLVIAHRLATAINSDRIVVIDRGRIVGIGRHEQLLRDNALYARLAELQFGERSDAA